MKAIIKDYCLVLDDDEGVGSEQYEALWDNWVLGEADLQRLVDTARREIEQGKKLIIALFEQVQRDSRKDEIRRRSNKWSAEVFCNSKVQIRKVKQKYASQGKSGCLKESRELQQLNHNVNADMEGIEKWRKNALRWIDRVKRKGMPQEEISEELDRMIEGLWMILHLPGGWIGDEYLEYQKEMKKETEALSQRTVG